MRDPAVASSRRLAHARRAGRLSRSSTAALLAATAMLAGAPAVATAAPSPSNKVKSSGGNFGLGLALGSPTGLSAKLFLHPNHALQWGFGWDAWNGAGRLHMDYLWHAGVLADTKPMTLIGYVGGGIGVGFWANTDYYCGRYNNGRYGYEDYCGSRDGGAGLFIRIPALGLAFHWKDVPMDLVVEGAWSPYVAPFFDPTRGDFAIASRWYF
jgi:hypothetical protein